MNRVMNWKAEVLYEPCHEKTCILHMVKNWHRSAAQ